MGFTFGTKIYLDSEVNWLDLGGERSKVKVAVASHQPLASEHLKESLPIWCEHTVGPKDALIRNWCEVKSHGCYKVMAVLM